MSYMTIFSQEKHHFSLCSYFHAHPTTLLLKILGGPMHGPSPTSNFGGPVPLRSPPLLIFVNPFCFCVRRDISSPNTGKCDDDDDDYSLALNKCLINIEK